MLVLRLYQIESEIRVYLVLIATLFVVLAVPISLYSIRRHLLHFWVPPLQVYVVRILWMVPVYSVCTLASLYLWVAGLERGVYIAGNKLIQRSNETSDSVTPSHGKVCAVRLLSCANFNLFGLCDRSINRLLC